MERVHCFFNVAHYLLCFTMHANFYVVIVSNRNSQDIDAIALITLVISDGSQRNPRLRLTTPSHFDFPISPSKQNEILQRHAAGSCVGDCAEDRSGGEA